MFVSRYPSFSCGWPSEEFVSRVAIRMGCRRRSSNVSRALFGRCGYVGDVLVDNLVQRKVVGATLGQLKMHQSRVAQRNGTAGAGTKWRVVYDRHPKDMFAPIFLKSGEVPFYLLHARLIHVLWRHLMCSHVPMSLGRGGVGVDSLGDG
jgi:hypothetical protein